MEIQHLIGFMAVARTGSFSKAAQKTYRTQPAISLQVQALEAELGVKLFDRTGKRKVRLTREGQVFLDLAEPVINSFDDLKSRFNETLGQGQSGMLRIATHMSVMVYLLPRIIKSFKKRYPGWELSVVHRSREDIVKMVADGDADIGITSLSRVPAALDYQVFARFRRLLIVPPGHPLTKKKKVSLADIAVHPLLLPPTGSHTRAIVDEAFRREGLEYRLAMEATGRLATKAYVEMGLGVSIVNEFYIFPGDRKKIVAIDVSSLFGVAERGLLTRKDRYLPEAAREFMDMVRGFIKDKNS